MEDKPLSNVDLEEYARKYKLPLVGVFSKDQLPDKVQVGSYYVNMQNSDDGSGSHSTVYRSWLNIGVRPSIQILPEIDPNYGIANWRNNC
jgi:hypothetical protein